MVKMALAILIVLIGSTYVSAAPIEVRVRIEATLPDAVKLLERLNANGKEVELQFRMVEEDYEFRIAVGSEGWSAADVLISGGADASAAILSPDCRLLFIVARSGRLTQSGALNAVSKEIAKKLSLYLKATRPPQAASQLMAPPVKDYC